MTRPARYLLDTNILSDLVKHPHGVIAKAIARVGEDAVFTSIIVACELRFGVAKKGSVRLAEHVDAILAEMDVTPFDTPADHAYGELRQQLAQSGTPIGPNDMLIAAHAIALDAVLVTANEAEFSRVRALKVENWLGD